MAKKTAKQGTSDHAEIEAKQAAAYRALEPYLCDAVLSGKISGMLFDCIDREMYDFAVHRTESMMEDLRERYYALDFPPQ